MKRKALIKFAAILCIVVSVFVLSLNLILRHDIAKDEVAESKKIYMD